jgi:hypothetical protein
MITIQSNIYSGRTSPDWQLSGAQASQFISLLKQDPSIIEPTSLIEGGFGVYGSVDEVVATDNGIPQQFKLVHGSAGHGAEALNFALKELYSSTSKNTIESYSDEAKEAVQKSFITYSQFLLEGSEASRIYNETTESQGEPSAEAQAIESEESRGGCTINIQELSTNHFNSWNNKHPVAWLQENNCYSYAMGRLTWRGDTGGIKMPQPGQGATGQMLPPAFTRDHIMGGLQRDKVIWMNDNNCLPDSQVPRWQVGMWLRKRFENNQILDGYDDFHFVRRGFYYQNNVRMVRWANKKGRSGTDARDQRSNFVEHPGAYKWNMPQIWEYAGLGWCFGKSMPYKGIDPVV